MIALLLHIAIIGVIAWAITLIPMPGPFKQIIIAIAVIYCVLLFLAALGLSTGSFVNLR